MLENNKVALLLDDLQAQFRTFGEGLQLLNEKVDRGFDSLNNRMDRLEIRMDRLEGRVDRLEGRVEKMESSNQQEHQQLMQMITELDRQFRVETKGIP